MRDPKKYFKELLYQSPEIFSNKNRKTILNGRVPIVDKTFVTYFPQYKDYMYKELRHHHIGGGGQAMPISSSLHEGSGGVHNVEKDLGIFGDTGNDKVYADFLQNIKDRTVRTRNWNRLTMDKVKIWDKKGKILIPENFIFKK